MSNTSASTKISVITPTYNRLNSIERSINSSLHLLEAGFIKEIIIVDDASTDGTFNFLQNRYRQEISEKKIITKRLAVNQGVTGAKNTGAKLASGNWLIFMDSDDMFDTSKGEAIINTISREGKKNDLIFFRCRLIDSGELIGEKSEGIQFDFSYLLEHGTPGECLPAVNKNTFIKNPYRKDLRGCESLTYLEILQRGHTGYISKEIVRLYSIAGSDRLSTKKGILARSSHLAKYNFELLKFRKLMSKKTLAITVIKILAYYIKSKEYNARNYLSKKCQSTK